MEFQFTTLGFMAHAQTCNWHRCTFANGDMDKLKVVEFHLKLEVFNQLRPALFPKEVDLFVA